MSLITPIRRVCSTGDIRNYTLEYLDSFSLPSTLRRFKELPSKNVPCRVKVTESEYLDEDKLSDWKSNVTLSEMARLFAYFTTKIHDFQRFCEFFCPGPVKSLWEQNSSWDEDLGDYKPRIMGRNFPFSSLLVAMQLFYGFLHFYYLELSETTEQFVPFSGLDDASSIVLKAMLPMGKLVGSMHIDSELNSGQQHPKIYNVDREMRLYCTTQFTHLLVSGNSTISFGEFSDELRPTDVSRIILVDNQLSDMVIHPIYQNRLLTILRSNTRCSSDELLIGEYDLTSSTGDNSSVQHPCGRYPLSRLRWGDQFCSGPTGCVYAFRIDDENRVNLVVDWDPKFGCSSCESSRSLKSHEGKFPDNEGVYFLCISVKWLGRPSEKRSPPVLVWYARLPMKMEITDAALDLLARSSGCANLYYFNQLTQDPDHNMNVTIFRVPITDYFSISCAFVLYAFTLPNWYPFSNHLTKGWMDQNGDSMICIDSNVKWHLFQMDLGMVDEMANTCFGSQGTISEPLHKDPGCSMARLFAEVSSSLLDLMKCTSSTLDGCSTPNFCVHNPQRFPMKDRTLLLSSSPEFISVSLGQQRVHLLELVERKRGSARHKRLYTSIADTLATWIRAEDSGSLLRSHLNFHEYDASGSGSFESDSAQLSDSYGDIKTPFCTCSNSLEMDILQGIPRELCTHIHQFGRFGMSKNEFREPNAVAVLPGGIIAVADGNAEMIKFFSPEGYFISNWKITSTRSTLAYPNCIAVSQCEHKARLTLSHSCTWPHQNRCEFGTTDSADPQQMAIVVVLRKPCPAVQVYSLEGQKLREFGQDLISPKCVTVDCDGRIIVVENHIMRVSVYAWSGYLLSRFLTKLAFPVSVAVDSNSRIYITDNLRHCITLYAYTGDYLGCIGGRGLTSYPLGVAVFAVSRAKSANEYVVVADNHNNLNITVFQPSGHLIYAMRSGPKHAQIYSIAVDTQTPCGYFTHGGDIQRNALCSNADLDSKSMITGSSTISVVFASKDYRIYRYFLPKDIFD
ncbi:unnamed protein product [Calicophoron daubneyi]|uniref:Uncharacterized protein n=1 Tax=Calicophoron daubneyi TaxID=300641 RepID=A0AAV2SZY6_CALDB